MSFVIIAHNYPAHFGRLWELEPGAEVYFTDMAGTRTLYIVERQERQRPGDTRGIVGAGADAAHLHTGRQKPRSRCVAAVLHRKKPIDCDIGYSVTR